MSTTETPVRKLPRLGLAARVRLAGEILSTWRQVHRLPWRRDLPGTVGALRAVEAVRPPPADDELAYLLGMRLGYAVTRTLPALPGENRCLMRSLILTRLLARRQMESTLILGVRPAPDFGSHAWVELGGRPILPPMGRGFTKLLEL